MGHHLYTTQPACIVTERKCDLIKLSSFQISVPSSTQEQTFRTLTPHAE